MSNVNKVLGVETGDISKIDDIDSGTIKGIMGVGVDFSAIPIGLIVPLNDTSVPAGWERFTAADNRMIVGAGSTYSVGDMGGSTSLSGGTTNTKAHTGNTMNVIAPSTPGGGDVKNDNPERTHSHTWSGSYLPNYQNTLLIKATQEHKILPAKSIIMTFDNTNPGSLTSVFEDNRFIRSNSDISPGNSQSAAFNTTGSHKHGDDYFNSGGFGSNGFYNVAGGDHTHSLSSFSITQNIKRTYLRAWTNASTEFDLTSNVVGMYESLTLPDGWILCDGNNGTLDLRDYFIIGSDSGNAGNQLGNNTISGSGSSSSNGLHRHWNDSWRWNIFVATGHHPDNEDSHNHTMSVSQAYTPPYYSLSFIMKAA